MQDLDTANRLAEQRYQRALAQQLQAGQSAPTGNMVGGIYVRSSPFQHLAEGLRMFNAGNEKRAAEQELKDISGQRATARQSAMADFLRNAQGAPADELAPDLAGPVRPAVAPDMGKAYAALMQAPDPQLQQAGMQGMIRMPELKAAAEERTAAMDFKRQEAEAMRAARMEQLNLAHQQRMEALQAQSASREQMAQAQREFQREMQSMRASMPSASAQPYFQPVQTAQGVMAFNARTGRVEPVTGADGAPIIGAAADPSLQGNLAGAKVAATRREEGIADARGDVRKSDQMIQQLDQAGRLLAQNPTGSGIGAALDVAGRAIGVSRQSAQVAGQLEALSGWLVANVPRMEGPQSNFDVQNYQTMAGKIGDRTVPVAERQAALNEVRRLQEKYKEMNQTRIPGQAPARPAQGTEPVTPMPSGFRVVR